MPTRRRSRKRTLVFDTLEDRRLMATIELGALTPTQGVTLFGADAGDESGFAVSRAGDVNRDGFDDWIIGAPRANGSGNATSDAGESYLIYGSPTLSSIIDLTNVGTTIPGTKFFGTNIDDLSGMSVSQAGDINGDGFQDLLIGAYQGDAVSNAKAEAGEVYLVFGSGSFAATINLSTIGTTTPGVKFFGADVEDYSGNSVNMAGDVNGDGFDDLIIGAYKADASGNAKLSAGESYLVFGNATLPATIDLNTIGTTVVGVKIFGAEAYDYSGRSVSSAGDFNGDGFDDLVIGAPYADGSANLENLAGDCYLIFGGPSIPVTIDLTTVGSTTPGILFFGSRTEDYTGRSVSSAGDINGDGFDDLLIGAHFGDAFNNTKFNAGDSFLIFGRATSPATIDLANTGGSVPGIKFYGTDTLDQSGFAVSNAGDVNGDGFDDLLIGAYSADGASNAKSNSGETYLVFGAATMPTSIDQTNVGTSVPGLVLFGVDMDDFSGRAVSGAGDVNGDGFGDMLIGANRADGSTNAKLYAGESYLIYGSDLTLSVTHPGTSAAETLTGSTAANTIVGGRGNDVLLGLGGADVQTGGQGNDILAIGDTTFKRIVGGTGTDTLRFDGSGISLDLTMLRDNRIQGIEAIDVTGVGVNSLTLNLLEVLNLSNESNTLLVRRNFGDVVNIGSGWTQGSNESIGGNNFAVYTQGRAILKIQEVVNASIVARQVFYNRSPSVVFGDGSGNPSNAIDTTKVALLPGQETTTANYTNYSKGLNGLVVDVANLAGSLSASDFQFATWDGISVSNFVATGAAASISVLPGAGAAGSSRVKIEFADQAIRNTWLRVTVLANSNTGLAANDVFYFGNAIADIYIGNVGTPISIRTNATDTSAVRQNQSTGANSVSVTNIYDVNKDGRVNATDTSIVRQNQLSLIMRYFSAPAGFLATSYLANSNPSLSVPHESSEAIRERVRDVWWIDEIGSVPVVISSGRARRKS